MKYIKLLFLLLATSGVAQNYNYGLESPSNSKLQENLQSEYVENLQEEQLYFEAYLLPSSRAYELQHALDTYGSVRLEKGTYPGPSIVMKSGQILFGHPHNNKVPNITVKAGSQNVRIQNVDSNITFEAGSEITNCIIKNIRYTPLKCTDCRLVNNSFINLERCKLVWDCSDSGYFRNNKIIKHLIQEEWPQIVMKGNSKSPSYGNVSVWLNLLTPGGHAAELENVESLTWVGIDAESWNWKNASNKALLHMRQMGSVNLTGLTGGTNRLNKTPVFDIEADELKIQGKLITSDGGEKSKVRENTKIFTLGDEPEGYILPNIGTGYSFESYLNNTKTYFNEKPITATFTGSYGQKLEKMIMGSKYEPWDRGQFEELPQPLEKDWKEKRKNQPDQSEFIQNLIDSQGIAELDEGTYFIGKSLTLSDGQGIVGKGTGKTILIGLTDNFPLIIAKGASTSVNFTLAHMTLQGGNTGLQIRAIGSSHLQVTACAFKFLIFRNQEKGIHLNKFYGFDNNFFDHVSFVNCGAGIYQEVDPNYIKGETATMMYVDKIVFYESQFINCGVGVSLMAERVDNLIGWVNCKFDGNRVAADLKNHKGSFFANCDFVNTTGDYVIGESHIALYSCLFKENKSHSIFGSRNVFVEGSTFYDTLPLFSKNESIKAFILNSKIHGSLGRLDSGMLINSSIGQDATLSKILIDITKGTKNVLINEQSEPYSQLLVTQ